MKKREQQQQQSQQHVFVSMNASLTPNQQKLVCNHFTYNTVKPCQTYKLLEFLTIAIYDPVICKEKFRSKKKGKKRKKETTFTSDVRQKIR